MRKLVETYTLHLTHSFYCVPSDDMSDSAAHAAHNRSMLYTMRLNIMRHLVIHDCYPTYKRLSYTCYARALN